MHDVFEIGFRKAISNGELMVFLSEYFHLDEDCIVSEDEYWSEAWEGKERLGISVQTAVDGLKTNISGISFRELGDIALGDLAREAAYCLNSEAVIGDYRKCGDDARGRFLSYFPDGSVWESVDTSEGRISDVRGVRQIQLDS